MVGEEESARNEHALSQRLVRLKHMSLPNAVLKTC